MKLFIKGTLTQIWKPANIFVLIGKWYAEGFTLRTWDMWKVCLQTFRNNRINFLRNLQTSRASNSRILKIKNAKYSGYCFYMNTNIYRDFQICISVPLTSYDFWKKNNTASHTTWKNSVFRHFSRSVNVEKKGTNNVWQLSEC